MNTSHSSNNNDIPKRNPTSSSTKQVIDLQTIDNIHQQLETKRKELHITNIVQANLLQRLQKTEEQISQLQKEITQLEQEMLNSTQYYNPSFHK